MFNIPDLYVLEEPIDTSIGQCRFLKVKEYHKLIKYTDLLNLNKNILLNRIFGKIDDKIFDSMIDESYLQIIKKYDHILGLYDICKEMFTLIFDKTSIDSKIDLILIELEDKKQLYIDNQLLTEEIQQIIDEYDNFKKLCVFDRIQTDEELEQYCKLIKEMNCVKDAEKECDSELAYYDKLAQIVRENKGEIMTFKSMVTSVGLYRQDVLEMSIYNLHEYFNRISCFKNYETEILYSTIPSEKPYKVTTLWFTDNNVKKTKLSEEDMERIEKGTQLVQKDHSKEGIVNQI